MGKGTPMRPSYTANLRVMIEQSVEVRAMCDTCKDYREVDLARLAAIKGGDYDLWGRRTRCRLTEGCRGWNKFYFNGRGRFEPMRD